MTSSRFRRLHLESLECRRVLHGGVAVSVTLGNLIVTGDAADNYLAIWQDGVTGDWVVAGGGYGWSSPQAGTETTVNGLLGPQTFGGVTGSLLIDTGVGADQLLLTNTDVTGNASIQLGDGFDRLWLTTAFADRDFSLNQGDTVPTGSLTFQQTLQVDAGAGHDHVAIDGHSDVNGDFEFWGRDGEDWLHIITTDRWLVQGNVFADLGDGDDQWDLVFLDVGGNLTLQDPASATAELTQNETHLRVHNTNVGGNITVIGGTGSTRVEFENVTATAISATLGDDPDTVHCKNVNVQTLDIDLGAGDDSGSPWILYEGNLPRRAFLHDVHATTSIDLKTGSGDDTVYMTLVTSPLVTVDTGAGGDGVIVFGITGDNAIFNTGDDNDVIGLYLLALTNLTVQTGAGDEGNGFYGIVVGDSTITNSLLINSGSGYENILLGSVVAHYVAMDTSTGYDGVIVLYCDIDQLAIDTGDEDDVAGIHDSIFEQLQIDLGNDIDHLWLGNVTVTVNTTRTRAEITHETGTNWLPGL